MCHPADRGPRDSFHAARRLRALPEGEFTRIALSLATSTRARLASLRIFPASRPYGGNVSISSTRRNPRHTLAPRDEPLDHVIFRRGLGRFRLDLRRAHAQRGDGLANAVTCAGHDVADTPSWFARADDLSSMR